jgi:hypothetical protein
VHLYFVVNTEKLRSSCLKYINLGNIINSKKLDNNSDNFYFTTVYKISFRYENARYQAIVSRFVEKRNHWYRITLPDGENFFILPDTRRMNDDKIVWRQQQIPGEPVHPEEFIQSIGQGLLSAGLQ